MLYLVPDELAKHYAHKFCPTIYQKVKSDKDYITKIMLLPKDSLEQALDFAIYDPALYYRVLEDKKYIYIYYMVFHPFDWSSSSFDFIAKLDSHQYDTEGFCIRVYKFMDIKYVDIATIFHHSIECIKDVPVASVGIWIEPEGHGIKPFPFGKKTPFTAVYAPETIELVNFGNISTNVLQKLEIELHKYGVDMPDEQENNGILFNRPDKYFNN